MPDIINSTPFKKPGFILIGADPFAVNENGDLIQRIQTFFVDRQAYITVPGTHADQRLTFVDFLNQERENSGQPKLTSCECDSIFVDAVSIVIQFDDETGKPYIGVRNDGDLSRAVRGREVLCQIYPEDLVRIF